MDNLGLKKYWLVTFKSQWKEVLRQKLGGNLAKLATVDMHALAREWFDNALINQACSLAGVTAKDIEEVLISCRDELLSGGGEDHK